MNAPNVVHQYLQVRYLIVAMLMATILIVNSLLAHAANFIDRMHGGNLLI
jgi:hypothetical protein